MKEDIMTVTILADGRIKTETDLISPANHNSAHGFLKLVEGMTGGTPERHKRSKTHLKQQVHEHKHEEA